jgi:hypothetical protein
MAANEKISAQVAAIASKAMQNPKLLTPDEIQSLAASVLTQVQDRQQDRQGQQQGQQHVRRSIESTQRVGIVMIPLACAFLGLVMSPMLWQTTFTSASSRSSHPTVAHSIGCVCGNAERCCQEGIG